MEIKSDQYGYKFEIPDRPTVRQQMEYLSDAAGEALLVRFWLAAKTLITKWQCEKLPDFDIDLDKLNAPSVTMILIDAGLQVKNFMDALEDIPKN